MESLLNFFIRDAAAQTATGATADGAMGLMNLLFPIILIAAFYFLLIRPQTKRAKEHKQMVDGLKKGDEIVTGGGVLARITDVGDNFVQAEIADGVQIRVQKQAVGSLMPKGTFKGNL
ncbi:MAG TPA: preprotein translocase subunit YajC [Candidatus Competibacter sp.]|nr:preprotein translocase subunit YajC [Candidatus Competibacteraceae bacterium]HRC71178.1 preprotein translocase subunit YajC [Candidatus Competibacter sp.]